MAADALKTPTDLPSNATKTVAEALNGILADTFALYMKTKNFHWHVSGPHFRDYHLMLDEQAEQIFAGTDDIAERIPQDRQYDASARSAISRGTSPSRTTTRISSAPPAMLSELRDDNLKLVEALREAKDIADEGQGTMRTSAMIDDWTDQAERRAWFLFEAGRKG